MIVNATCEGGKYGHLSLLQNHACEPYLFCGGRRNWKVRAAISGMMRFRHQHHKSRKMDTARRDLITQRWNVVQHDLLPELRNDVGTLTPKLEKVIYILEWVRIEEFVDRHGAERGVRRTDALGWRMRLSPSPYWG